MANAALWPLLVFMPGCSVLLSLLTLFMTLAVSIWWQSQNVLDEFKRQQKHLQMPASPASSLPLPAFFPLSSVQRFPKGRGHSLTRPPPPPPSSVPSASVLWVWHTAIVQWSEWAVIPWELTGLSLLSRVSRETYKEYSCLHWLCTREGMLCELLWQTNPAFQWLNTTDVYFGLVY